MFINKQASLCIGSLPQPRLLDKRAVMIEAVLGDGHTSRGDQTYHMQTHSPPQREATFSAQ